MKAEYAAVEAEMRRLGVMCQLETRWVRAGRVDRVAGLSSVVACGGVGE